MANIPDSYEKPKFFKIMVRDFDVRLRVPNVFVENFGDILRPSCKLKGPNGDECRVEVRWEEDGVFFSRGWSRFTREQSLVCGDFLVFFYEGNSTFKVFVFHKTGCELPETMMEEEDDFGENRVENEIRRSKTHLNAVYKGKSKKKVESLRHGYLSENENDKSVDGDDSLSVEDGTEASSARVLKTPGKQTQKRHFSRRRKVSDEEKEAASEKACAYVMKRRAIGVPIVGIILQPTHVCQGLYLTIPKDWAMENIVRADHDWELRVLGSNVYWLVGCRWSEAGQCQLRPKWPKFVLENNLEEGDTCVFELLFKGTNNSIPKAVFKVSIFRVVEEIVPLICKRVKVTRAVTK